MKNYQIINGKFFETKELTNEEILLILNNQEVKTKKLELETQDL